MCYKYTYKFKTYVIIDSAKRTQVIDDESDYFSTDNNQWLNTTEKQALSKREEELRSLKYASRRDRQITFDFAGRRIIEEDSSAVNLYNADDSIVQKVNFSSPTQQQAFSEDDFKVDLVHPSLERALQVESILCCSVSKLCLLQL